MTAPTIDPEAGAEILVKETTVDDTAGYLSESYNYIRIKLFNAQGIEQFKTLKIETDKNQKVYDLAARVIQPDGTILTLNEKDVFVRDTYTHEDARVTTTSFSIPGLKSGSIIEYHWRTSSHYLSHNVFFRLADVVPVHTSRFRFRPDHRFIIFFNTFKVPGSIVRGDNEYWGTELHNLPAIPDDSYLPSAIGVQPWVIARYALKEGEVTVNDYWKLLGKDIYTYSKKGILGDRQAIKKKAAELTKGITDPTERLKRLYNFCACEITNIPDDNYGMYFSEVENKNDDKIDAVETLKTGRGKEDKIDFLFASLAEAAGFDVNMAICNRRSFIDWDINCLNHRMLWDWAVAIKNGDKWDLYQPGVRFLQFGMLRSGNEHTVALLGNYKKADFMVTNAAKSVESQVFRTGTFTITEDGTLQGSVTMRYTGHEARDLKFFYSELSTDKMEDKLKTDVQVSLASAQLSNIEFKNIDDPINDVEISYDVSVSGYADVSEQRIFLQPSYFVKGKPAVFIKDKRDWDVRFPYTWETHDSVKITYPDNFVIEEGAAPKSIPESAQFGYTVTLGKAKERNEIIYKRDLKVNVLDIPVKHYLNLKALFDAINREDNHILTLQSPENAPTQSDNTEAAKPAEPTVK